MIQLRFGENRATIDPLGAWVTDLGAGDRAILFRRQQVAADDGTMKTRGGSHVCLPNFGPDQHDVLSQHGFGRVLPWRIVSEQVDAVTLELQGGAEAYAQLRSQVTYRLAEGCFTMQLVLENQGDHAVPVAPAFHPYFAHAPEVTQVTVNDTMYDVAQLAGTAFMTSRRPMTVHYGEQSVVIASQQLPVWAIWTDQLGAYICVEPTAAGNAFLDGQPEYLLPQAKRVYSCDIRW